MQAVAPVAVEAAIAAMDLAQQQQAERRRALELETEQARYEARLAQRRYEAVDPDNRLVAAELEARWNAALAQLCACEQRAAQSDAAPAAVTDREALLRLAGCCRARLLMEIWTGWLMDISEEERARSRLADGAIIQRARGEDTAGEGLEPGRVQPSEENDRWTVGAHGGMRGSSRRGGHAAGSAWR